MSEITDSTDTGSAGKTMTTMVTVSAAAMAEFEREAILDADIRFPNAISENALDPHAVFLTGGTGLVGTYLLEELLRRTRASIYCLIRSADADAAKQRIIRQLQSYGLWRDEFKSRVITLPGDVACPRLGLSETLFNELAGTIDVIYHSAGIINMRYSYAQLKPANVQGVKEALRLAGLVRTKPFHFVSSIAVFYSDAHPADRILTENSIPQYDPSLKGDYSKSKWVADRLVAHAQERGLPACIYRPTRIMGHSRTGVLNDTSEILPALLKGCIAMGFCPDWDIEVTLVPVDYVSRSMVYLAGKSSAWGKAFHLFNPQPIHWRHLMEIVRTMGYPLQEISFADWRREINARASRNGEQDSSAREFYSALVLAFMGLHYLFRKRPPFDGRNVVEGLAGSGISCPPIDRALIEAYLGYWQKTGFLPKPPAL